MISFIKDNKRESTITRRILDGIPLPIALFSKNNELIFINDVFTKWFMFLSPGVFELSDIRKIIDQLMSNELVNTLTDVSLNQEQGFVKEVLVRTTINEHKSLKISLKQIKTNEDFDGVLMFIEDKPQNEESIAIYKKQAHIDQLTGVFNRFGFHEAFNLMNHKVVNNGLVYAVLVADIDELKHINDINGHLYGDDIIKEAADILSLSLREEDILCRWGGDEFIVVLANAYSISHLKKLLDQILERIDKLIRVQKKPVKLSIGSAICHVHGESLEELINYADMSLYKMKRAKKLLK